MTHELEPILQDGEHARDDSELLTQDWVVEGIVVTTDGERPRYVVTEVISGHDKVYPGEYRYHELSSPNTNYILSPEKIMNSSYRAVYGKPYYTRVEDNEYALDTLFAPSYEAKVGDRIKAVRWSQKIPTRYDVKTRKPVAWEVEKFDTVLLLESDVDISKEENAVLKRKKFIRTNLAGILRRLEEMQLQKRERLETNVETDVNWEYQEEYDRYIGKYTYGESPIEDHFVKLVAKPYARSLENPLPGDLRFTQNGRGFLQRDITAGGTSKELALIDEPLVELSASVWTQTAFNPEVGDVRVDFIVDGIRYAGSIDVGLSSRSFRSPGHHLEFNAFSDVNVQYDGVEIKADEIDAILTYTDLIRRLEFRASRAGIEEMGNVHKELAEAPSSDVMLVQTLLGELQLAGRKALQNIQPILDQIAARPSDSTFGGVRLLVPQSKLKDVKVVMRQEKES